MASTTKPLSCSITITAIGIGGSSVACQFNAVRSMNIDWSAGKLNILDATGSFNFGLSEIATVTYTVAGTVTTVVIS